MRNVWKVRRIAAWPRFSPEDDSSGGPDLTPFFGCCNAPIGGNLRSTEDPRFLDPAEMRARYDALGAGKAEHVVAYCGSGVNACQAIFAMNLAGIDASLYEGSWSDWSRTSGAPIAVGKE